MNSNETSGRFGTAIGAVLILAVVIFALFFMFKQPTASSTTGTMPAGGIQYAVTPLSVTRNAEGQYAVEAEIVREDAWRWVEVSVHNIGVTGHTEAAAKLVSELPKGPIPERFVLKFVSDAIDSDGKGSSLRFDLEINANKHLGLSHASSQRSNNISLEPMDALEE